MDFDSTIIWRNMLGDFLYAIAINTFTEEETIYKSIGTVMNYKPFIAHMKNSVHMPIYISFHMYALLLWSSRVIG